MCYWLQEVCPIENCEGNTTILTCPSTDGAGYCEKEKTGSGTGFGKYLFPIHRSLFRISPCKIHMEIYAKEGVWKKKDGTEIKFTWLKPGTSLIVDQSMPMGAVLEVLVGVVQRAPVDES